MAELSFREDCQVPEDVSSNDYIDIAESAFTNGLVTLSDNVTRPNDSDSDEDDGEDVADLTPPPTKSQVYSVIEILQTSTLYQEGDIADALPY